MSSIAPLIRAGVIVGQIAWRLRRLLCPDARRGAKSLVRKNSFRERHQSDRRFVLTTLENWAFYFSEIMVLSRHPVSRRGAFRDRHGTRGGGAVDARVAAQVLRGRTTHSRTVKSCGPGAPELAPSPASVLAHHVRRRGQSSRSPRRARINVKTIARGRPDIWLILWFCRVLFCCTRTAGVSGYPVFPAPSSFPEGGTDKAELGHDMSREREAWLSLRAKRSNPEASQAF